MRYENIGWLSLELKLWYIQMTAERRKINKKNLTATSKEWILKQQWEQKNQYCV